MNSGRAFRILVVSPPAAAAGMYETVFSASAGFVRILAHALDAALITVVATPPDVVVVHGQRPPVERLQTVERLARATRVPILMCSVERLPEQEQLALRAAGLSDLVVLPRGFAESLDAAGIYDLRRAVRHAASSRRGRDLRAGEGAPTRRPRTRPPPSAPVPEEETLVVPAPVRELAGRRRGPARDADERRRRPTTLGPAASPPGRRRPPGAPPSTMPGPRAVQGGPHTRRAPPTSHPGEPTRGARTSPPRAAPGPRTAPPPVGARAPAYTTRGSRPGPVTHVPLPRRPFPIVPEPEAESSPRRPTTVGPRPATAGLPRRTAPGPRPVTLGPPTLRPETGRPSPGGASPRAARPIDLVVIGSSTGGPAVLAQLFGLLPVDLPPVVIAQHLLDGFSASLAVQLDHVGRLLVREGFHGAPLVRGVAYIAPSGVHTRVVRSRGGLALALEPGSPGDRHRPSVDVLFHSAASVVGDRAIGLIMTGMGADGAAGLLALRRAGATTLAQDEASSAVFGMAARAMELGAVARVAAPAELATVISTTCLGARRFG